MTRNVIVGLIAVIIVAGLALAVSRNTANDQSSSTSQATVSPTSSADAVTKVAETNSPSTSSTPSSTTSPTASTQNVKVTIKDYVFSPATLTVKKGTTVTWTNNDSVQHNAAMPSAAEGPHGPLLNKGESYSYTFNKVGTYDYVCEPHASIMRGRITVTE